ncbi:MAG: serine/threonine-protein kinase [Cyanobacteria bacterium P01_A01_bin.17]
MTTLLSCSRGHPNPSSHRFCERCGEQLEQAIRPGKVICDRYRVIEALGQGGFGQTYLVEDSNRFNERCVLKVFAPSVDSPAALEKAKELFNREAEVLYRLEHPQIPRFREWFTELPALYLVQDYVEGQTYQMLLKQRQQPFSESEVASFLRQALPVLDYIHGRGMVHRDISPDNLMRRSCDRKPVLIDFGGVKEITASLGRFGAEAPSGGLTLIGKPGYAPEEQIRLGRVSPASDIYALGVTALVLLVGQEPQDFFDANTCTFKWQPFVNLSPGFAAVLETMVASHAVKRYRTAAQVLQDLEPLEIPDVGNNSQGTLLPDAPNTMPPATAVENPYLTQQEAGSGARRLLVAADFDESWDYVFERAKNAGLSIFTRNKSASKLLIGCADIPDEGAVAQSGRWTIFRRDSSAGEEDYCALLLDSDRNGTQVRVLNKQGKEVQAQYAEPILASLIGA